MSAQKQRRSRGQRYYKERSPSAPNRNRDRNSGLPGIDDFDERVRGQVGRPSLKDPLPGIDDFDAVIRRNGRNKSNNKDALKLRLDINLDVAVELKAHVHGDIQLSLL